MIKRLAPFRSHRCRRSLLSTPSRLRCFLGLSQDYCYHNGMHFLNAHASFDLWVERNLQKIDPRVSLALWDFMLDSADLGTDWGSSEIFGPDMFGSALGSPETQFQISDGWFAGVASAYDKDADLLSEDSFITTNHNAFGLVDGTYNYQVRPPPCREDSVRESFCACPSPLLSAYHFSPRSVHMSYDIAAVSCHLFQALGGVVRTNSYCGLESASEFTKCEVFVGCFEYSTNIYDWASCMEHSVRAHGWVAACTTSSRRLHRPAFGFHWT